MVGYIYKFTLIPTNLIYVGKRHSSIFDVNYYGSGKKWKIACSEYSRDDIKREILEWCETEEMLNKREKYWIKKLDSRNPAIGYNISAGGQNPILFGSANGRFNVKITEETRQKLSASHKGIKPSLQTIEKRRAKNKGKKRSKEFKEHLKKVKKGVQTTSTLGKKWMYKGDKNIIVPPEDVENYLKEGYILGRSKKCVALTKLHRRHHPSHNKGKMCITDGKHNWYISKNDLIPAGWRKGNTKGEFKNNEN